MAYVMLSCVTSSTSTFYVKTGDWYIVCWVLFLSLLQMLNISVSDREQDKSMCLQRLEDVKEEENLIERTQPQVSHYTQDGVN